MEKRFSENQTLNTSDLAHGQRNETVLHAGARGFEIFQHGERREMLVNGGIGGLAQELPDAHGKRNQAHSNTESGMAETSETAPQPVLSTREHLAAVLEGIDNEFLPQEK